MEIRGIVPVSARTENWRLSMSSAWQDCSNSRCRTRARENGRQLDCSNFKVGRALIAKIPDLPCVGVRCYTDAKAKLYASA